MRKIYIPLFVFTMLFFAAFAFAEIRVTAVKGTAAYKIGNQWVPLQAGAVLAVGTKVSTGVRSKVDIRIHNHTVTVLPLTIMKISESTETAKTSTTRIGLRRGAVHSRVARDARIKTVFKVSTPVATSSVRGSEQITICGPTIGMKDIMLKDAAEVSGPNSAPKFVSGDLQYRQRMDKPEPESLMVGMEDYLTRTHSLFITLDEDMAFKLFGDDFLFYDPGFIGPRNQNVVVPVSIFLIWPVD